METYNSFKPKILIIDESIKNLILIKSTLQLLDVEFFIAQNAEEAIQRSNNSEFDLIMVDTMIQDLNAYELCKKIKNDPKKSDTSIIFLSAAQSREDKVKGFKAGADDYLIKPLYHVEVLARVKVHLQKHMMIKQLKQLLRHSYHELYNPLAVIETSAQMYDASNKPNKYVNAMHAAAKSLHIIYEDLYYALSSNKEKETNERIDFVNLLKDRVSFFTLLAEVKSLTFELHIEEDIFVFIPAYDLQRIIDNTISNAIKYAFEDSIINVTLSRNNNIDFSVSNIGSNIKDSNKIFTQGYREAYEQNGMGIGLEIVSSICNRYAVNTSVVSKDNKTRFTYTFNNKV